MFQLAPTLEAYLQKKSHEVLAVQSASLRTCWIRRVTCIVSLAFLGGFIALTAHHFSYATAISALLMAMVLFGHLGFEWKVYHRAKCSDKAWLIFSYMMILWIGLVSDSSDAFYVDAYLTYLVELGILPVVFLGLVLFQLLLWGWMKQWEKKNRLLVRQELMTLWQTFFQELPSFFFSFTPQEFLILDELFCYEAGDFSLGSDDPHLEAIETYLIGLYESYQEGRDAVATYPDSPFLLKAEWLPLIHAVQQVEREDNLDELQRLEQKMMRLLYRHLQSNEVLIGAWLVNCPTIQSLHCRGEFETFISPYFALEDINPDFIDLLWDLDLNEETLTLKQLSENLTNASILAPCHEGSTLF